MPSLTISLIYDLRYATDFALVIAYRHGENVIRFIASLEINFTIETWIIVCIPNVHHLLGFSNMSSDTNAKWNNNFLACTLNCFIES